MSYKNDLERVEAIEKKCISAIRFLTEATMPLEGLSQKLCMKVIQILSEIYELVNEIEENLLIDEDEEG